jgi:transcriptional regulator with XRE-family HTH domain
LSSVRTGALALLETLQALVDAEAPGRPSTWHPYLTSIRELAQAAQSGPSRRKARSAGPHFTPQQLLALGHLLRDRRNAAGLSRVQLASKAKLSDATIKFIETARHVPSRASLIRLLGVEALQLRWADLPGQPAPPAAPSDTPPAADAAALHTYLNCYLAPGCDPLSLQAEGARLLGGAGGVLEQTHAYLDPDSARGYLSYCQASLALSELRAAVPLAHAARQIVTAGGPTALQVVALGSGDGQLETRLVRHLIEAQTPHVELCLVDISPLLLNRAYHHAADLLADVPQAQVLAIHANFHHLTLVAPLMAPRPAGPRRLVCLLGGTLGHLDDEPRFLQQALLGCQDGDLLLLDIELGCAARGEVADIQRRDQRYREGISPSLAAWLSGPLWRQGSGVTSVDWAWYVDTQRAVAGSYALEAQATVRGGDRADRRFSMFRFARYDPAPLAACLRALGWEELGALTYGEAQSLRLYRKSGPDAAELAQGK